MIEDVRVIRQHTTSRSYDAVVVFAGGLHLSCDVVCEKQIRLAKRIADHNGCPYYCDPEIQDRYGLK